MIVVDASLATKWLLNEHGSDRAREFLQRNLNALAGPDLLIMESSSAVVRAANMKRIGEDEARHLLGEWFALLSGNVVLTHRVDAGMVAEAGNIALRIGHPMPDCVYLALAVALDCDLATCDANFRDKAFPKFGRVKLLEEFAAA